MFRYFVSDIVICSFILFFTGLKKNQGEECNFNYITIIVTLGMRKQEMLSLRTLHKQFLIESSRLRQRIFNSMSSKQPKKMGIFLENDFNIR